MTTGSNDTNGKYTNKTGDIFLDALFLISMLLAALGINIYRLTIIDNMYLFGIIVFGILMTLLLLDYIIKSSYSAFWSFIAKSMIGGGFFFFGFLFFNQKLADKNLLHENFRIIKTGTLGRSRYGSCFPPFVVINFYGTEKELVFPCNDAELIAQSTSIALTYSKGALGSYCIISKQLKS